MPQPLCWLRLQSSWSSFDEAKLYLAVPIMSQLLSQLPSQLLSQSLRGYRVNSCYTQDIADLLTAAVIDEVLATYVRCLMTLSVVSHDFAQ